MKKLLILILCLNTVLNVAGQTPKPGRSQRTPSTIAVIGGTLIDGSGRTPLKDSAVLIEGDHIKAAGARKGVRIPKGALIIDARGLVVAPGFIDMHNHSQGG